MRFMSTYAHSEHNTTESPYFLEHLLQDSDHGDVSDAKLSSNFLQTGPRSPVGQFATKGGVL